MPANLPSWQEEEIWGQECQWMTRRILLFPGSKPGGTIVTWAGDGEVLRLPFAFRLAEGEPFRDLSWLSEATAEAQ